MDAREEITAWFAGRIREPWFTEAPEIQVDRDEILVTGRLSEPDVDESADTDARHIALASRIDGFREDSREQRVKIALEAEHRFDRKVSWAACCGDLETRFTVAAVPVMTRLRMDQRAVLDTLIDGNVARSRSEALAWCVKLVGEHESDWINDLRTALTEVDEVRARGPKR